MGLLESRLTQTKSLCKQLSQAFVICAFPKVWKEPGDRGCSEIAATNPIFPRTSVMKSQEMCLQIQCHKAPGNTKRSTPRAGK